MTQMTRAVYCTCKCISLTDGYNGSELLDTDTTNVWKNEWLRMNVAKFVPRACSWLGSSDSSRVHVGHRTDRVSNRLECATTRSAHSHTQLSPLLECHNFSSWKSETPDPISNTNHHLLLLPLPHTNAHENLYTMPTSYKNLALIALIASVGSFSSEAFAPSSRISRSISSSECISSIL